MRGLLPREDERADLTGEVFAASPAQSFQERGTIGDQVCFEFIGEGFEDHGHAKDLFYHALRQLDGLHNVPFFKVTTVPPHRQRRLKMIEDQPCDL